MKRALNPSEPGSLLPGLPPDAEILVIRLRSLGDVVLLTPALAALHTWRRDLRISVLVEQAWVPVLEGNPAVAEILIAGSFVPTAARLYRKHFPVVFNQHGGPSSALLTAASAADIRVCWRGRQFDFLYNVLAPDAAEYYGTLQVHTVEQRMAQFYWTGLPRAPIPRAQLFAQPDAIASVAKKLQERGVSSGQMYAVLQPGARFYTKQWPIERFVSISRWLRETYGVEPIVSLGPDELEIANEARGQFGESALVLASLDLRELIALIAGARLFVGNDAGPAHLAAAAGTPSVVIFGSSSSVHWRPWQAPHRVVQNDFQCNPCKGDRCYAYDEPRCILSVTYEQVRDACDAILTNPSPSLSVRDDASAAIHKIDSAN
ncbi:MAG TPA: glycosyltransferase family 9 protein [Candidatus Acidoferrales bacterium]|nr:glycosyltransferase family 9 protein [Candidatus Acidoferrales bacterium]